jgi:putative alpha-1,2-mannosidase
VFSHVTIALANNRTIEISASRASAANRYVQSLRVSGIRAPAGCGTREYECPWLPASVLDSGARLDFTLSADPNHAWGTAPSAAPPSITKITDRR